MRAQYHIRFTPEGSLIWDVRRLVRLAEGLPTLQVPLDTIRELDEPYWFGGPGDVATCRAVAEHARMIGAVDLAYPVLLSADGRVMDGMHRACRALLMGHTTIAAKRLDPTPEPHYRDVPLDVLPYDDSP